LLSKSARKVDDKESQAFAADVSPGIQPSCNVNLGSVCASTALNRVYKPTKIKRSSRLCVLYKDLLIVCFLAGCFTTPIWIMGVATKC